MKKNWKNLEVHVADLARAMWKRPVSSDRLHGVNFDSVIRISEEEIVILEVTEEFSLEKIRGDVTKIAPVKIHLSADSIIVRGYIVLSKTPTQGMRDIGKPHKIKVLSIAEFEQEAFDFTSYQNNRSSRAFGSAVDPVTGKSDIFDYIPVSYIDRHSSKRYSINDVAESLSQGKRIVLLGEYGTGKSRCAKELFLRLASGYREASSYPLAINLREHWGAQTGIEIVAGHLSRLGLSELLDRVMQLLANGNICLLLDGFDELGAQTFGAFENEKRKNDIRKQALTGVHDLIALSTGPVLVTGREHYFHDNKDLLDAIGLSLRDAKTHILGCRSEFEEVQANQYIAALGLNGQAPSWLPKKPLMFQILGTIDKNDAERILSSKFGEIGFWGQFIDAVCIRESKAHSSIDPSTVKEVLQNLARTTRYSPYQLGRLTPKDVNAAYEKATGGSPDDAGNLMLTRLCTLGRVEPESPDRQFVDPYIVQLLFADCVTDDIATRNRDTLSIKYEQPLNHVGLYFLAQWIDTYDMKSESISYLHCDPSAKNSQVLAEIVSALLLISEEPIDFDGVQISYAELSDLSLSKIGLKNISLKKCVIWNAYVDNCIVSTDDYVELVECDINTLHGVSSKSVAPAWIKNCSIKDVIGITNSSRIKSSGLPPAQKLFLSIVHKIFFQRGGGRKENTLFRGGYGQAFDKRIYEQILSKLISNGIIHPSKDSSGAIYNPNREFTHRMAAIRDQLTLSKDPLWIEIGQIQ